MSSLLNALAARATILSASVALFAFGFLACIIVGKVIFDSNMLGLAGLGLLIIGGLGMLVGVLDDHIRSSEPDAA